MITHVVIPPLHELTPSYRKALIDSPSLTPEEEKDLASRMHQGDQEARGRLFQCNQKLVLWIAKRYVDKGIPLSDLIQEGNIGLLKALDYFDPDKGYRFATYASWWILSSIRREVLTNSRTIHIPVYLAPLLARYVGFVTNPEREADQGLSDEEVAEELDLNDPHLIAQLREAGRVIGSLGTLVPESRDNALAVEEVDSEAVFLSRTVEKLLSLLNQVERSVLVRRFGLESKKPLSLRETGNILGVSYERVRQIQKKALGKLRQRIETDPGFH